MEKPTHHKPSKKKKMIQNGDIKASEDTLKGKKRRAGETKEEGDKKKDRTYTHTHTHRDQQSSHRSKSAHYTHTHAC